MRYRRVAYGNRKPQEEAVAHASRRRGQDVLGRGVQAALSRQELLLLPLQEVASRGAAARPLQDVLEGRVPKADVPPRLVRGALQRGLEKDDGSSASRFASGRGSTCPRVSRSSDQRNARSRCANAVSHNSASRWVRCPRTSTRPSSWRM